VNASTIATRFSVGVSLRSPLAGARMKPPPWAISRRNWRTSVFEIPIHFHAIESLKKIVRVVVESQSSGPTVINIPESLLDEGSAESSGALCESEEAASDKAPRRGHRHSCNSTTATDPSRHPPPPMPPPARRDYACPGRNHPTGTTMTPYPTPPSQPEPPRNRAQPNREPVKGHKTAPNAPPTSRYGSLTHAFEIPTHTPCMRSMLSSEVNASQGYPLPPGQSTSRVRGSIFAAP
jgi:hypothetical protein